MNRRKNLLAAAVHGAAHPPVPERTAGALGPTRGRTWFSQKLSYYHDSVIARYRPWPLISQ